MTTEQDRTDGEQQDDAAVTNRPQWPIRNDAYVPLTSRPTGLAPVPYYYGPPAYASPPPVPFPGVPPHQPAEKARPTTSPDAMIAASLGGLAMLLALAAGRSAVAVVLGIAALVCSIVAFARNEPSRGAAAVGLILGILVVL